MDDPKSTRPVLDLAETSEEPYIESNSGERSASISGEATSGKSSPSDPLWRGEQRAVEAGRSCEARWLQLFKHLERQYQDQIVAQQEQFNCQIQLIHSEIKHVMELQGRSYPPFGKGEPGLTMANYTHPLTLHSVQQHPLDHDRSEDKACLFPMSGELNKKDKTFITQEHFLESTSVSSGYGTHSASEPNACLSSFSQNAFKGRRSDAEQTLKECGTESLKPYPITQAPVQKKLQFIKISDKNCQMPIPGKSHLEVAATAECNGPHLASKSNMERSCSKPLTSWAQKLKQNQHKKTNQMDPGSVQEVQENSPTEKEPEYKHDSSHAFYLNNRTESANSIVSSGSGFTYWNLDEKDMYHPLPESFQSGLSTILSTREPEETRIPSLTDIYQQKQRESTQHPEWKLLSPSEHTHPPEVLTLDPTLHKKVHHGSVLSPVRFFSTENSGIPLTPDSILENAPFNLYNIGSMSAATSCSSMFGEYQDTPSSPGRAREGRNRYQSKADLNCQLSHLDTSSEERVICTDDEANSLTPSSVAQSPLPCMEDNVPESTSFLSTDHPVMLSNIRRSLREKHARHIADLRDYYESEIGNLKQQLQMKQMSSTFEETKKVNNLLERCDHFEVALTEASTRIRILENKNNELEIQVSEWKEQYQMANNSAKALQEHVEEMRVKGKEKENSITRLQSKLRDVEEAFEKAFKVSDKKDARMKQEHKMFQDLLSEYDSLGKEHERVKDTLNVTENKLCDAHAEINELKRTIAKLESQIKQMEHENMVKLHNVAESELWQSSSRNSRAMDVAKRKCLTPTPCSIFTGQPIDNKESEENMQQYVPDRYNTPPEKESLYDTLPGKHTQNDSMSLESPILKALRDYEEKGLKNWDTQTEKGNAFQRMSNSRQTVGFSDSWSPRGSPDKHKERQRQLNSSPGPRSSSLPPINRKPTTPTKRELMLTPISVKYSPKRSPRENLSPGLSQLLSSEETNATRFDVVWDNPSTVKDPSPRKRLQFTSPKDTAAIQNSIINPRTSPERSSEHPPVLLTPYETEFTYKERMKNIAATEMMFDELTQEKLQIEAVLSRMPGTGARSSLQTRAKKEALEDRLEKINRELGSIRMTLKKWHVLPTSANI
ncbi:M-phase phosphoprotein 9 isoform 1-T2 [Discoglossus pictus]